MKKRVVVILLLLAVLAVAAAGGFYYFHTHLFFEGEAYSKDITELTLSQEALSDPEQVSQLEQLPQLKTLNLLDAGITPEQYDALRQRLPECEILWKVPFQGQHLDPDTEELQLSAITEEELALLSYFPRLSRIDARECTDLNTVSLLQEACPDCEILYQVQIGSQKLPQDAQTLSVSQEEAALLGDVLSYLPQVQEISVSGRPDKEEMYALKQAYPEITFLWEFQMCGLTVSSSDTELDLSGIVMESVEEVERNLKYFNGLERVDMCGCGIPSVEMDALWKRHPETRFVWYARIGRADVRTDVIGFIPYTYGYSGQGTDPAHNLSDRDVTELKYLVDLVVIDLGHMAIRDLSFLQYMPNLEYVLLCDNGIRDVSPLAGLTKLRYLELFNNPISDISALAECPALEDVNVTYNTIQDVTPLLGLENLNNLWITGGFLTNDQIRQLQEGLPGVNLVLASGRSTAAGWRELPNYYAQRDILGMWYMTTP